MLPPRRTTLRHDDRGTIHNWSDLRPYGIDMLTGEACGYGGRALCDLTAEGVKLIQDFMGITIQTGNGWNAQGKDEASIMLPYGIFPDLAIYCLMHDGWQVVVKRSDVVMGYTAADWEEFRERYLTAYPGAEVYVSRGTAGLRNRHEMSGRVT